MYKSIKDLLPLCLTLTNLIHYNILLTTKRWCILLAILMLRELPVYDISNDVVINNQFCPFNDFSDSKKAYKKWRDNRVYLKTNRMSERLVNELGGSRTREASRRLSLSDCYWIRHKYDDVTSFESITPYLNRFSEAYSVRGNVPSPSVPELVLGGAQPKVWACGSDNVTYMRKSEIPEQIHTEMLAVKLAHECKIPCMNAFVITEKGRLYANKYTINHDFQNLGIINLVNFTNIERSMIQFDQLNIGVNGFDPASVAEGYKRAGVQINQLSAAIIRVVFDCIVGNIDRETNTSNWAIFINNTTGERTPSHLYDFNWARLTENEKMIKKATSYIKSINTEAVKESVDLTSKIKQSCKNLGLAEWESNAKYLETELGL